LDPPRWIEPAVSKSGAGRKSAGACGLGRGDRKRRLSAPQALLAIE
jgi:hypothetical protein